MATLNTQFPAASRRIRRIVAVGALVAGMLAALFASPSAQAGQGDANRSAQTGKPIPGHYIVQVERRPSTEPRIAAAPSTPLSSRTARAAETQRRACATGRARGATTESTSGTAR